MPIRRLTALAVTLCLAVGPVHASPPPETTSPMPPWLRVLKGEDAKEAARLNALQHTGIAGAIAAGEALLALRTRVQGADHYETISQRWEVAQWKTVAALDAEKLQVWQQAAQKGRQAYELLARGRYRDAQPLLEECVQDLVTVLGEQHPKTAEGYNGVAYCLQQQGQLRAALPLFEKALQLCRRTLGEHHPNTAGGYNNLAVCLQYQGRHAEALPLLRQFLRIQRQVMGEWHPATAAGYNNLATCLSQQGEEEAALPLLRRSLQIRLETLGEQHLDVAEGYNNLGSSLQSLWKPAEALPLLRKSLEMRRRLLGEQHPITAFSYNNVAGCLMHQGHLAEALPLLQKSLEIRRQVLGERHADTAYSYSNVASCLEAQDRFAEALPLFQRSLDIRLQVLGERHPRTAKSYSALAGCLLVLGRPEEALPLYQKSLDRFRQTLGENHPDTAEVYNNLAVCLQAQGQETEGLPLHEKSLDIYRRSLGEYHRDTAIAYNNLADCLYALGRPAESARVREKALLGFEYGRHSVADSGLERSSFEATGDSPRAALAATLLELGKPVDAWQVAESDLGRGLLDDLAGPLSASEEDQQKLTLVRSLEDRLLPLLRLERPTDEQDRQIRDLCGERDRLQQELAASIVRRTRERVLPLARIQPGIAEDAALVFWIDVDPMKQHLACVLRSKGEPHWVKLPGTGEDGSWTGDDKTLIRRTRDALSVPTSEVTRARQLCEALERQRLAPLEPYLRGVKQLFVVPVRQTAGLPVAALTDKYVVSYVPSGTHLARTRERPRENNPPHLLALGDPVFARPEKTAEDAAPPEFGLLVLRLQPGGNAQRNDIRIGDVLLTYASEKLTTVDSFTTKQGAAGIPVEVWRRGKVLQKTVDPGPLGVSLDRRPAREAIAEKRRADLLLANTSRGSLLQALPGTRQEVEAIAKLFPRHDILLGSEASEARLDTLLDQLGRYSHLHFATHGKADNNRAFESSIYLSQDALPDNARRITEGRKPIDGRLTAREVLETWKLNAELVVLGACETGLGKQGGSDGLLGFSQAFLLAGARSVVLSLWPVDDTTTALLMQRLYQNLLGKREGLQQPLSRTAALQEAGEWLRNLSADEAKAAEQSLPRGGVRTRTPARPPTAKPYAHPHYWAAFVLVGDPN